MTCFTVVQVYWVAGVTRRRASACRISQRLVRRFPPPSCLPACVSSCFVVINDVHLVSTVVLFLIFPVRRRTNSCLC